MLSLTLAEQSQPGYSLFRKTPPCCLSKDYLNYQTLESAKIVWKSLEKKDLFLTKTIVVLIAFDYSRKTSKPTFFSAGFLYSCLWSSGPEGTCKPAPMGTSAAARDACLWLHRKPSKRPESLWRCLDNEYK